MNGLKQKEAKKNIGEGLPPPGDVIPLRPVVAPSEERPVSLPSFLPERRNYHFWKRTMDIALSGGALALLSPLFLLTAAAVKLSSPGPVLCVQTRIGKEGVPFPMYKFRSMYIHGEEMLKDLQQANERDGPAFKMKNDPRITPLGRILRKLCIDEMPQFFNVLRGEMSLVGPRPPLPSEVEEYEPWHYRRFDAKPGLTCYWQVSDRNMSFDEWVDMDIRYIQERCLAADVKLLWRTASVVLRGKGDS